MIDKTAVLLAVGLVFLSTFLYRNLAKKRVTAPFPPGPKGLPFLGNVIDLPQSQPWVTFAKWGEIYGGIVRVSALGNSIIVLNDAKHAVDMLDKKGRLYCDRPTLTMAGRLVGWDQSPPLMPLCDTWSEMRRMYFQFMGTRNKIDAFNDVFQGEAHNFLKRILADPAAWAKYIRQFAGAIVLTLAYGYTEVGEEDPMVKLVDEAMSQFSETTVNNAFLVDVFPILRHVPEWLPGASWKKKIPKYRKTLQDTVNMPYDWVLQQIAAGTARPSFISSLLVDKQHTPEDEHLIKWAAAGIYGGGADTTVAGIESFVLAMALQPSAQQTAQAELDAVVGTGRLPTLADRAHLPYVDALFTEVLRTYTFGPLGLPHVAREDDVHNGYFIPKGSIIIANVWQFFKDPKIYANPGIFSPERFMSSKDRAKETDPREYLFGFGRRACPGIHLADASMWLACASVLAAFDIRPSVKDGKPVHISGKYMDGSISHPEPFECVIKPRSPAVEMLIHSA